MSLFPDPGDGTSFYRGVGPLEALGRQGKLSMLTNPIPSWVTFKAVDALFLQRPFAESHVSTAKLALLNRKPIWVDYDDNLLDIPRANGQYKLYSDPMTQHNVVTLLQMADVVTVTTESIAKTLRSVKPEGVVVVPNAYDNTLLPDLDLPQAPREKLIVWRGGGSHDEDLWTHTPTLRDVVRDHPDWTFEFLGDPFWLTMQTLKFPNVKQTWGIEIITYMASLVGRRPSLMIVPLHDCAFNRGKSNIAWLEATSAGAVTLAPDWPEWRMPGVVNYKDPADFGRLLADYMAGRIDHDDHWQLSRTYIQKHLLLTNVNKYRAEILDRLKPRSC